MALDSVSAAAPGLWRPPAQAPCASRARKGRSHSPGNGSRRLRHSRRQSGLQRRPASAMECPDGTLLFRILDPGERKVLSIHGIPASLKEGDRIPLHFRVMVNGYCIQSENFTDILVLKLSSNMIWLKKDETTYFVLQR